MVTRAPFEIWRPADKFPEVEREEIRWMPAGNLQPFVVKLAESFDRCNARRVCGIRLL